MNGVLIAQTRTSLGAPRHPHHGGSHHGSRFHSHGWGSWRDYIPQVIEVVERSAEDDAAVYLQHNDCVILRRVGGRNVIRTAVVDILRSYGWVERTEGNIVKLCPPTTASAAVAGLGRIIMGQGPARLRVSVVDRRGQPGAGIPVVVLAPYNIGEGTTDDDGAIIVNLPEKIEQAEVIATLPEGEVRQRVPLAPLGMQTVHFQSIRKIAGPIITLLEGSAIALGAGLIISGILVGKTLGTIMEGVGGSVTIAAAYSTISRQI